MNQTTIERLNDDVLLEIFKYLDGTSLKYCTIVCKRWLEVIVSTASTMKKLPLWIDSKWKTKDPPLNTVQRNFHSVHAYLAILKEDQFLSSLLNSSSIRHLTLEEVRITRKCFCQLMFAMTMLDELVIDDSWISKYESGWTSKGETQKGLEKLVMNSHEWEFLTLLKKMEIPVRELKLLSPTRPSVDNLKHLRTFFCGQHGLKSLAMDVVSPVLEVIVTVENSFELESLYVKHHASPDEDPEEALMELLERHRSTLENLELFMNLSEESLQHIVKTLKIKRLILSKMPEDGELLTTVTPNKYLKKLIFIGRLEKLGTLKWLLRNNCDLETLVIKDWIGGLAGEFLDFICDHLKCLQHLELPTVECDPANQDAVVESHQISSLKSFRVENLQTYEALRALHKRLHAIETLSIKWLPKGPNLEFVSSAALFPHLQHIRLGARFEATDQVLKAFSRDCPKLRKLEILKTSDRTQVNKMFENTEVLYYSPRTSKHIFSSEKTLWQDDDDEDGDYSSDVDSDSSRSGRNEDSDMDGNDLDFDYVQDAYGQGDFGYLMQWFRQR